MFPIRRAGVVAFLDWIKRMRPNIRSLRTLDKDEFMQLAVAFEKSKGLLIDPEHEVYRKWESTQETFAKASSDSKALKEFS